MAKRAVRKKPAIEYKTDFVNTTDATVTNGEFDLDLLPNELAEILGIKSIITGELTSAVIDQVQYRMYLSLDPDADDSPLVNANLEDAEIFYIHDFSMAADYAEATETGGYALKISDEDQMWFPTDIPMVVGTNFSQVVIGDAAEPGEFITTIYFRRRKASNLDIVNALLKRR